MSLGSFWRKLMPFQHMGWVECCVSRHQRPVCWIGLAEVHIAVGKGRQMDRFLISCLFLPQTTFPSSLQIYHSWEGILWQLLIKILAAYYCSLQMMWMDHRLIQCWKAALSEVKCSLSITATCTFPHWKADFKFFFLYFAYLSKSRSWKLFRRLLYLLTNIYGLWLSWPWIGYPCISHIKIRLLRLPPDSLAW